MTEEWLTHRLRALQQRQPRRRKTSGHKNHMKSNEQQWLEWRQHVLHLLRRLRVDEAQRQAEDRHIFEHWFGSTVLLSELQQQQNERKSSKRLHWKPSTIQQWFEPHPSIMQPLTLTESELPLYQFVWWIHEWNSSRATRVSVNAHMLHALSLLCTYPAIESKQQEQPQQQSQQQQSQLQQQRSVEQHCVWLVGDTTNKAKQDMIDLVLYSVELLQWCQRHQSTNASQWHVFDDDIRAGKRLPWQDWWKGDRGGGRQKQSILLWITPSEPHLEQLYKYIKQRNATALPYRERNASAINLSASSKPILLMEDNLAMAFLSMDNISMWLAQYWVLVQQSPQQHHLRVMMLECEQTWFVPLSSCNSFFDVLGHERELKLWMKTHSIWCAFMWMTSQAEDTVFISHSGLTPWWNHPLEALPLMMLAQSTHTDRPPWPNEWALQFPELPALWSVWVRNWITEQYGNARLISPADVTEWVHAQQQQQQQQQGHADVQVATMLSARVQWWCTAWGSLHSNLLQLFCSGILPMWKLSSSASSSAWYDAKKQVTVSTQAPPVNTISVSERQHMRQQHAWLQSQKAILSTWFGASDWIAVTDEAGQSDMQQGQSQQHAYVFQMQSIDCSKHPPTLQTDMLFLANVWRSWMMHTGTHKTSPSTTRAQAQAAQQAQAQAKQIQAPTLPSSLAAFVDQIKVGGRANDSKQRQQKQQQQQQQQAEEARLRDETSDMTLTRLIVRMESGSLFPIDNRWKRVHLPWLQMWVTLVRRWYDYIHDVRLHEVGTLHFITQQWRNESHRWVDHWRIRQTKHVLFWTQASETSNTTKQWIQILHECRDYANKAYPNYRIHLSMASQQVPALAVTDLANQPFDLLIILITDVPATLNTTLQWVYTEWRSNVLPFVHSAAEWWLLDGMTTPGILHAIQHFRLNEQRHIRCVICLLSSFDCHNTDRKHHQKEQQSDMSIPRDSTWIQLALEYEERLLMHMQSSWLQSFQQRQQQFRKMMQCFVEETT